MCSDGLTDLVDEETIASALLGTPSSDEACAQLVQLALERGGRDNVTAIVAAYTIPDEHAQSAPEVIPQGLTTGGKAVPLPTGAESA